MKKAAAISDFLEAHAKGELTEEILNNLADAVRKRDGPGRPGNTLREVWMLALRAIYTIERQAELTGRPDRKVSEFAKNASDHGWEIVQKAKTPENLDQVWVSGSWGDQPIILAFTFKEMNGKLLTSYTRIA